jgi:hypothetical protein
METVNEINWYEFLNMIPFMMFGIIVHIFGKFTLAQRKPGYSFGSFVHLNWSAWMLGTLYALIGCYLFTRLANIGGGLSWDVFALINGIGLGSLGKTTVKLLSGKEGASK